MDTSNGKEINWIFKSTHVNIRNTLSDTITLVSSFWPTELRKIKRLCAQLEIYLKSLSNFYMNITTKINARSTHHIYQVTMQFSHYQYY